MKTTAVYIRCFIFCVMMLAFALQCVAQAKVAHLTPAIQKQTAAKGGENIEDKQDVTLTETEGAEGADRIRKMAAAPHPAKNIKPEVKRMQQLQPAIKRTGEMLKERESIPDGNAH